MPDKIPCPGRKLRVYTVACITCHLSEICKMERDSEKSYTTNRKLHKNRMLIDEAELVRLKQEGKLHKDIAKIFGCTRSTITKRFRSIRENR